jgi:nucleotide-binding universal stress UspA family protein
MFKKILVPLDRSPLAEQALGPAAAIARASKAEMELVLVHQQVPFVGFTDAPWNAAHLEDDEKYLASKVETLASCDSVEATYSVLTGDVVEMICERAGEVEADLITITSHGRTGISRAWLGSVADSLVRRAPMPILMLRPVAPKVRHAATHNRFQRILVPLDGSALAMEIIRSAADLSRCCEGRLILLRIVQPVPLVTPQAGMPIVYPPSNENIAATDRFADEAEDQLDQVRRTLREQGITGVETQVIIGSHVAREIIDFARTNHIDTIAMSTHARGASRLLVGSVADKVLRGSGLPILIRRPVAAGSEPAFIESAATTPESAALAIA